MEFSGQGKMETGYFKDKTEKEMIKIPDCSYARFVKRKFPQAWERYVDYQNYLPE